MIKIKSNHLDGKKILKIFRDKEGQKGKRRAGLEVEILSHIHTRHLVVFTWLSQFPYQQSPRDRYGQAAAIPETVDASALFLNTDV